MKVPKEGFVAVHVGAGQHSEKLREKYEALCQEACKMSILTLKSGNSVLDAVANATIVLEDSPLTNAGYGSNLTCEGNVECDASIMDGPTLHYGAVGAATGIKNPIIAAKCLCERQSVKRACGMVQPSFLVGPGAQMWAKEMNIQVVPPDCLITEKAQKIYKHCKRKLENTSNHETKFTKRRMDTVGAICVDEYGNIASACSSGGIILKYPGRVGQAGVWGCGVWACKSTNSIGVTTSGCGEHIVRTTLARTAAEAIEHSDNPITSLHHVMKSRFIDSPFLVELEQKLGGLISIKYSAEHNYGDMICCHSTKTMIVGYMNSCEKSAVSYMSKLDEAKVGREAIFEGTSFKLSRQAGTEEKNDET